MVTMETGVEAARRKERADYREAGVKAVTPKRDAHSAAMSEEKTNWQMQLVAVLKQEEDCQTR